MHIAVCIDNAANRKQMERLLHRASDHMPKENGFYIDSYGSIDAVMRKPKLYDLFLLDMEQGDADGLALAFMLRKAGATCPIVLCPYNIDYQSQIALLTGEKADIAASFRFLPQPVKVDELNEILEFARTSLSHIVPTIEIRTDKATYYVTEEEILYAIQSEDKVQVHLSNDRVVTFISRIPNFYSEIKSFSHIVSLSDAALVHDTYISSIDFMSVTLKNGVRLRTPHKICKSLISKGLPS